MKKEFKREKEIGAFELTIQDFSDLLHVLQNQNVNDKISFTIDIEDKNEITSFTDIETLNKHIDDLPNKVHDFRIWIRFAKPDSHLLEVDDRVRISSSGMIIKTAEITTYSASESWCVSGIAVVDEFLKKKRKWHWFVDYLPFQMLFVAFMVYPAGFNFVSGNNYMIAYTLGWLFLAAITYGHNKLFPSMTIVIKETHKWTEASCNQWMILFTAISSITAIIALFK